jgi:hypothetical protein
VTETVAVCGEPMPLGGVAVTVIVYVPLEAVLTELPPQPVNPSPEMLSTTKESIMSNRFLVRQPVNSPTSAARLSTPEAAEFGFDNGPEGYCAAELAVVVVRTRVAVPVPPEASVTLPGLTEHVALAGAPEHVRLIAPLNVALPLRFNVAMALCPRPTLSEVGVAENVKAGDSAETVTALAAEVLGLKPASPL